MKPTALLVVLPARDEQELLPAALRALARAAAHPGVAASRVRVVVAADDCRDGTAEVARRAGALVAAGRFGGAGRARAAAVEHGLAALGGVTDGVWIAVTDADSTVPPDWLARHAAWAARGWDAVAGTVDLPPSGLAALHRQRYEAGRPPGGAPWHHPHVHGANLGVSARAYRRVGGFPPLAVGEDRALVAALERGGHRVLRTAECPVLTSGRLSGRAPRGFAADLAALAGPPGPPEMTA